MLAHSKGDMNDIIACITPPGRRTHELMEPESATTTQRPHDRLGRPQAIPDDEGPDPPHDHTQRRHPCHPRSVARASPADAHIIPNRKGMPYTRELDAALTP